MGVTSFCIAETGETMFDADQTAREFCKKNATNAPTLADFQRYMIEAMKAYFRRVRWDFWPDTRMVDGEPVLFDIVLFFVDSGRIRTLITNSCTRRKTVSSAASLRITPASQVRSAEANVLPALRRYGGGRRVRSVLGLKPSSWNAGSLRTKTPLIETDIARHYAKRLIEIASQHEIRLCAQHHQPNQRLRCAERGEWVSVALSGLMMGANR